MSEDEAVMFRDHGKQCEVSSAQFILHTVRQLQSDVNYKQVNLFAIEYKCCSMQGRSHRGGHGGRVPRAPYYVPLHQNDNRQFVFRADF